MSTSQMKLTLVLICSWCLQAWAAPDFPLPPTTRQVQLFRNSDGNYSRRLVTVPIPQVGEREILLHVRAVSIQRFDLEMGVMLKQLNQADLTGQVAGSDAAGDVVRVGRLVTTVRPGMRVISVISPEFIEHPMSANSMEGALGLSANGVFGDYVVLKETAVVPMPRYLSYEEAATLPSSALTAWSALGIDHNVLRPGDTVLVEGTGGVSTFALQFAVAAGGRVIVTSSSDEKLQKARSLGATAGINYRKEPNWSAAVLRQTNGHGADLVVDIGGRSTLEQSMNSLAYEGNLAILGGLGGYDGTISAWSLMNKAGTARGIVGGARNDLVRMCRFMEQHRIHPVIDRTYPFSELERALSDLESGSFVGKLVLVL